MHGQTSRAYQMLVDAYRVVLERMHLKNMVLPAAMIAALCAGRPVLANHGAPTDPNPDIAILGTDAATQSSVVSGPVGSDGTYAYQHTVDANGVFAGDASGTTRTLGTQTGLIMYFHDAGAPDMYNATDGAGADGTWYNLLARNADSMRAYYAAMSGGRFDFDFKIVDVPLTPQSGGLPWDTSAAQSAFLPGLGVNISDYRFKLNFYQPNQQTLINNPNIGAGSAGLGSVPGAGLGAGQSWYLYTNTSTVAHELGHNLSFSHTHSLLTGSGVAQYNYDHSTNTYVAATATSPINTPIGVKYSDYGSPYSLMGGGQGLTPRQKQSLGWLDPQHFANVNALVAPGATNTLKIYDDLADMPVVVSASSGPDVKYGVAHGYRDVYYNASITRQGQAFHADSTNTGHWETYQQRFDFYYRSGADLPGYSSNGESPAIVVDLNNSYLGRLTLGQTLLEKDVAHSMFALEGTKALNLDDGTSVSGANTDLASYTIANKPQNPNRYRATWYQITYLSNGSDADGHYANLQIQSFIGSQVTGLQWNTGGGTAAVDGDGSWSDNNWHNVSANTNGHAWAAGQDAVFGAGNGGNAAGNTVAISGSVTANSVGFKAAGAGTYTLTGGTLVLGGGGIIAEESAKISSAATVSDTQFWTVSSGKTLTVDGAITTSAGNKLFKDGQGTLILGAANTWNADLTVSEGLVRQDAAQTIAASQSLRIDEGATYQVSAGTLTLGSGASVNSPRPFSYSTINGDGRLNPNFGTLRLSNTGGTLAAPEVYFAGSGNEIATKVLLDAGQHFLVTNGATPRITGDISGAGGIILNATSNSQRLQLGGRVVGLTNNTFTGDIEIQRGSLHVVGATSLQGNNALRFNVASGQAGQFYLRGANRAVRDLSSAGAGQATIANAQGLLTDGTSEAATLTVTQNNAGTYAGRIMDTHNDTGGSGAAESLSLTKQGGATLTLTGTNTYTGTTTIAAGTLQIGGGGSTGTLGSGAVVVASPAAELKFNRSDAGATLANAVSGTGILRQAGTGVLTQSGADTRTGGTFVDAGTLRGGTSGAFSAASTYTLANAAGATLDLNGTNQTLGALVGGGTMGGNVTLGAGNLTVGANDTNASYAGTVSGAGGLVKVGSGRQTLTAVQAYTGGTTVNDGVLRLNFGAGITSNLLSSTGSLTLGGGSLQVFGGSGADKVQAVSGTTLTANTSSVAMINAGTTTTTDLRLGNIAVGAGAALDFQGGSGNTTSGGRFSFTTVSGASVASGAKLGSFATWNGTDWAANTGTGDGDGGFYIGAYTGYTLVHNGTGGGTQSVQILSNAASDVKILESSGNWANNTLDSSSTTVNTLLMSAAGHSATVAMSNSTLTVGAVAVGAGAQSLTLGTAANEGLLAGSGSGLTLISNNAAPAQGLAVNAKITGVTSVVVSGGTGGGTVVFAGDNDFSGGTSVAAGATLQVGAGGSSGNLGSGGVSLSAGTSVVFARNDAGLIVSNAISGAGALIQGDAGTITLAGTNTYSGTTAIRSGGTLRIGNATNTGTVGTGEVTNDGTLVLNRSDAAGFTFSNAVSGAGALTQSGPGTAVLTGANTYSGTTTIDAGRTLQVGTGGAASTSGTLGSGLVANNGTLIFARSDGTTVSNTISGASGAVVQANATGVTTLTGANTYGGGTTVSAGALILGTAAPGGPLGTAGSGAITLAGGGLGVATGGSANAYTVSNVIHVTGNAAIASDDSVATFSGPVDITGGVTLTAGTSGSRDARPLTFSGGIAGSGDLVVQANGLTLHATPTGGMGVVDISAATTFTGTTTVASGTLRLSHGGALQKSTFASGGSGRLSFDDSAPTPQAFTFGGLSGGGSLALRNSAGAAVALTVDQSGSTTFSGVMSGGGSLNKAGSGTLTLTGANTYTGATTATGGVLALDFSASGAAASNIVSSSNALNLAGGTVKIIGPSSAPAGTLQTFGGLNANAGYSTFQLEQTGGTAFDVNVGAITLAGGAINFVGLTGTTAGARVLTSTSAGADDGATQLSAAAAMWNGTGWASVATDGLGNKCVVQWTGTYTALTTDGDTANPTGNLQVVDGADTGTAATFNADATIGSLLMTATGSSTTLAPGGHVLTVGTGASGNIAIGTFGKSMTIGAGTLTSGTAGAATLTMANANAAATLTVDAGIADNGSSGGAVSVASGGAGAVVLNGPLSYTGSTSVGAGSTLTVNALLGGGTYAGGIQADGNLLLQSAGNQILSGALSGDGTLTKGSATGASTLTLSGASTGTFTGTVDVQSGTLKLGAIGALGSGWANVASGATLDLNGQLPASPGPFGSMTVAGAAILAGTGVGGNGALVNQVLGGGSMKPSGGLHDVTLSADALVSTAGGNILFGEMGGSAGTLSLAGHTLTVNGPSSATSGAGVLILNNLSATDAGNIVVNDKATLQLVNDYWTGSQNGTTLSGAGSITLNTGSKLALQAFNGGMTLSKSIVMAGGQITSNGGPNGKSIASNISLQAANNVINFGGGYGKATFLGILSGAVGADLTVTGDGETRTFTGVNTYAGNTIVGSGAGSNYGTMKIGGAGQLGSGNYAGNIAINGANTVFEYSSSASQILAGTISGTGKLVQSGTGTTRLTRTNSYAGLTTVSGGILEVAADGALGTVAQGATVQNGATLRLVAGTNYAAAEAVSINGTGMGGIGAFTTTGGTTTFAGRITAATHATISSGGGTLNLTGGLVKNGTTLTLTGGGRINIGTGAAGTGIGGSSANSDLVVDNTTVAVTTDSDYNGPTTVRNNGVLLANATIGTTAVTVNTGGLLGGSGTIQPSISAPGACTVTIASDGKITGGEIGTIGNLTIDAPTLNLHGTYVFDVDYTAGDADTLLVSGTGKTIDFDGFSLDLNLGSVTGTAGGNYALQLMGWDGSDTLVNFSTAEGEVYQAGGSHGLAANQAIVYRNNGLFLEDYSLVPEPTSAAVFGLGALLLLRRPSRRRKCAA